MKLSIDNWKKSNEKLKKKIKSIEECYQVFNPGSPKQLAVLLHEVLELDITDTTKTGLASTSSDTIKNHIKALRGIYEIDD